MFIFFIISVFFRMKKLIEGFDLQLLFFKQNLVLCIASVEDSNPRGTSAFLLRTRGVVSCGRHQGSYETTDRPHSSVFLRSPFRGELSVPHSLGACLFFFFLSDFHVKNSPLQLISFPVFESFETVTFGSSSTEFFPCCSSADAAAFFRGSSTAHSEWVCATI